MSKASTAADSAAEQLAAAAGSLNNTAVEPAAAPASFVNQPDNPTAFQVETKFDVYTNSEVADTTKVVSELVATDLGNGFMVYTNVGVQTDVNWYDPASASAE
jgi:hypothetical protein